MVNHLLTRFNTRTNAHPQPPPQGVRGVVATLAHIFFQYSNLMAVAHASSSREPFHSSMKNCISDHNCSLATSGAFIDGQIRCTSLDSCFLTSPGRRRDQACHAPPSKARLPPTIFGVLNRSPSLAQAAMIQPKHKSPISHAKRHKDAIEENENFVLS